MSTKLPAYQWYPGDWRKDPGIQSLDYEARGIWRECLDFMHESTERGWLVFPGGAPMEDADIAQMLGVPEAKWKQTRSKLEARCVCELRDDGAMGSRRMARDETIRLIRAEAGQKGGKTSRPRKQNGSKTEANTEAKQEAKRGSSVSSSSSEESPIGPQQKRARKKPATPLPDNWEPKESHVRKAEVLGVDLVAEIVAWKHNHLSKDSRYADWDHSFHTWLGNTEKYGATKKRTTPQPITLANQW